MSEELKIAYDPEMTWYQVYCLSRNGQPITLPEHAAKKLLVRLNEGGDDWFECQSVHGCPCHIRLSSVQQIIKSDYESRVVQRAAAKAERAIWEAEQEEDKRLWRETMAKMGDMSERASDDMDEGEDWKKRE